MHPVGFDEDLIWDDVVLPDEKNRRSGYLMKALDNIVRAKNSPEDVVVADLEQAPGGRPRFKQGHAVDLFAMLSHGTVWNFLLQRPLLLVEWLHLHLVATAQVPSDGSIPMICDYIGLVDEGKLKPCHIKGGVGNGWHHGSVGSWVMFVLASVEFTSGDPVPRPVSSIEDATDETTTIHHTPNKRHKGLVIVSPSSAASSSPSPFKLGDADSVLDTIICIDD